MSIKRIAEMAGTSVSTVSRVLNNPEYKCSSEEVREKILKAARQINYAPNLAARNLKMGINDGYINRHKIGVLTTRIDVKKTDTFFSELLDMLDNSLRNNDCDLVKSCYNSSFSDDININNMNVNNMVNDLKKELGDVDGLIVVGKCNKDALNLIKKEFKHVVTINRNSNNYITDEVICDGRKLAYTAIKHLVDLGHRKIAYVGPCFNEVRYHGYLESMKAFNIDPRPNYIIETEQREERGYEAIKSFAGLEERPTAIYCSNDIIAYGMIRYLNENNHKKTYFPSIIGCDGIENIYRNTGVLTTVEIPKKDMARFGVSLLVDRIKGEHDNNVKIEMFGVLKEGETCYAIEEKQWYGAWS